MKFYYRDSGGRKKETNIGDNTMKCNEFKYNNEKKTFIAIFTKKKITIKPKMDLIKLDLSNNNLIKLPDDLPYTIRTINCSNNKLNKLPKYFPSHLKELNCNNNKLVKFLDKIPVLIETIKITNNFIENIITEGVFLKLLDCKYNQLRKMKIKSRDIKNINCSNNKLKILDIYSNTKIKIHCKNNKLNNIKFRSDKYSSNKIFVFCDNNRLKKIYFNKFIDLFCRNNKLEYKFIFKNNTLVILNLEGNKNIRNTKIYKNTLYCGKKQLIFI